MDGIKAFEDLVEVLKVGGGYAGWALFLILWWRADKRYVAAMSDLKDIALAKLENDVKTEETLKANAKGLDGIGHRLESLGEKHGVIKSVLEKILLIKSSKLKVE